MLSPWGQPQQTIKSPGREVLILSLGSYFPGPLGTTTTSHQVPRLQRGPNPLSGILIPRPPRDNHNKPSSPQATERS